MTTATRSGYQALNHLVHVQAILERARISADNQNLHVEDADPAISLVTTKVADTLRVLEALVEQEMGVAVQAHPAWPWLHAVKGIGPQAASLTLAYLLPVREDKGPSSWYKAAGLYSISLPCSTCRGGGVIATSVSPGDFKQCPTCSGTGSQNRLPRYDHLAAGEKATWHPRLRRNLYVVGTCLLRGKGFYYSFYLEAKAALELKHPAYKGRNHAIAFWKMVKLFLAHLWAKWCEAEGVKAREPYPMEILGHQGYIAPPDGG